MAIAKRKKRFFDVEIPTLGKTTQLQAYEIKELDGRIFKYDLTRILRGKNMLLQLQVKVSEDKATSYPIQAKLLPSYLKRVVRKGTNYVENSFSTECKNGTVLIKPLLVSRRKISRAVRKALRDKVKEELELYVKDKNFEILFDELLKNQIQKPLSLKLKKIYPLSLCEIRILKVTSQK
jgi:ribosomal protein S3AE